MFICTEKLAAKTVPLRRPIFRSQDLKKNTKYLYLESLQLLTGFFLLEKRAFGYWPFSAAR